MNAQWSDVYLLVQSRHDSRIQLVSEMSDSGQSSLSAFVHLHAHAVRRLLNVLLVTVCVCVCESIICLGSASERRHRRRVKSHD